MGIKDLTENEKQMVIDWLEQDKRSALSHETEGDVSIGLRLSNAFDELIEYVKYTSLSVEHVKRQLSDCLVEIHIEPDGGILVTKKHDENGKVCNYSMTAWSDGESTISDAIADAKKVLAENEEIVKGGGFT